MSISDAGFDDEKNVRMRVTFCAQFGMRSICLLRGLTNRAFWQDYPEVEKMRGEAVCVTPKVVCELIRMAHQKGWDPESSKSTFELVVNRGVVRALS